MEVRLAIDPVNAMGALCCRPPLLIAPGTELLASAIHHWVGGDLTPLTGSNWPVESSRIINQILVIDDYPGQVHSSK